MIGDGFRRGVVGARRVFCQVAVKGMRCSVAEVALFLGVITSADNRLAVSEELAIGPASHSRPGSKRSCSV